MIGVVTVGSCVTLNPRMYRSNWDKDEWVVKARSLTGVVTGRNAYNGQFWVDWGGLPEGSPPNRVAWSGFWLDVIQVRTV